MQDCPDLRTIPLSVAGRHNQGRMPLTGGVQSRSAQRHALRTSASCALLMWPRPLACASASAAFLSRFSSPGTLRTSRCEPTCACHAI